MKQGNGPLRAGVEGGSAPSGDVQVDDLDRVYVGEGDVVAGKYRVERLLGVGGMGFVVAARHLELDGVFALKFLKKRYLLEKVVVDRFTREAKAACRIRSEYVARVYDVGTNQGAPFLVMDHLVGRDLAALIGDVGWLAVDDAVEYTVQACAALTVAHGHGVIHRDIKPENLFVVDHEGHRSVKLLDFGISKVALADSRSQLDAARLTGSLILGSPFYMSPEQIRSTASVDAASDQWSLGAVLYEMLTGHAAFAADSVAEVCAAILEREPRALSEVRPEVPEGLAEVVARCLQKDPVNRFRTVAELAVALLPFAPLRALAVAESSSIIGRAAIHALGAAGASVHPSMGALRVSAPVSLTGAPLVSSGAPAARNSLSLPTAPSAALRRGRPAFMVGLVIVIAAVVSRLVATDWRAGSRTDARRSFAVEATDPPVAKDPSGGPAIAPSRPHAPDESSSEPPALPAKSSLSAQARPVGWVHIAGSASSKKMASSPKSGPIDSATTPSATASAPTRGHPDLGY
jgi:eukaryotic-like serine/threonine-protein kinase